MSTFLSHTKAELMEDIVRALEDQASDFCILNGYQDYPDAIDSDIDAISANPRQIPHILTQLDRVTLVQVLRHETNAYYYILYRASAKQPAFIALDVSADYRRNGRIFFSGEEFLQSSQGYKFFKVPSANLEFAYYLVKKLAKGDLNQEQAQRLSDLYQLQPQECRQQLQRLFPETEVKAIAQAAQARNWQSIRDRLKQLRQIMLNQVGTRQPLQVLRYWLSDFLRRCQRLLQPTGLMVVFLGADGSGKSTIIERVKQDLSPVFRQTHYIHLRPRLGLKVSQNSPVVDPHGQASRGWLASVLKLFYFLFDYGIGYWWRIRPLLVRSTFVMFDRYYHDLLVDPKRYRFGANMWLAKLFGLLIPKPDLWILLDATAEVLQGRKQEVTFAETQRQRQEYLKLVATLPNAVVADSSQSVDCVVADVNQAILDFMAARTKQRLKL